MKTYIIAVLILVTSCATDCEYRLPKGYTLVQNGFGEYAVREGGPYSDGYIDYNFGYRIYQIRSAQWVTMYSDSCRAKEIAKQYIMREHLKDAK